MDRGGFSARGGGFSRGGLPGRGGFPPLSQGFHRGGGTASSGGGGFGGSSGWYDDNSQDSRPSGVTACFGGRGGGQGGFPPPTQGFQRDGVTNSSGGGFGANHGQDEGNRNPTSSFGGRGRGFCDGAARQPQGFQRGGGTASGGGGGFGVNCGWDGTNNQDSRPSEAAGGFGGGRGAIPPPPQGFQQLSSSSGGGFGANRGEVDGNRNPPGAFGGGGEDGAPRPPPNNYIPAIRTLDELYKEDSEHAENYRQIADDDDEIHLSGPNLEHYALADTWHEMGFSDVLLKNIIERSKYIRPRKIQAHVIPVVMDGRDVKGHAETGSGKTAAFMLPIIHNIMNDPNRVREALSRAAPYAIIVEPTRELCSQVYEQGRKFANETGVTVAKAYGQYKMSENLNELRAGCDILCATPGRLKHFVQSNLISVEKVKYFVLDEADTLLETNFLEEIREVLNAPNFPNKENRQTMLFSATFPEIVQKLSMDVLKDDCIMVSNRKMVAANSKVIQHFVAVSGQDKKQALLEILQVELEASKKVDGEPKLCRTLVFVRTKRDADLVSLFLCEKNIKATTINGDRPQNLREKALRDFRENTVSVLVSTDVCARGIDIKDLDHVINMDLPSEDVTYVHRIGRTGRLKSGRATSFFDEFETSDVNIAKKLVEFVQGVGQQAPEFLVKVAEGGGGGYGGGGGNFGGGFGTTTAATTDSFADASSGW